MNFLFLNVLILSRLPLKKTLIIDYNFELTFAILVFKFKSSSVRRSSFRDKEKAARKLDTSFKDVLYATEHHETENNVNNYIHIKINQQMEIHFFRTQNKLYFPTS